ncbi:uncharacterized protein TRIADDRAFT_61361 [Trichoplax adhaerens]|uniref:Uncharacterized protein n=1 Tax=Trichoplax adhaerens TaxID=10228 RepID=B3SAS3_TRIAD|nr:predicted protein [Trichoplax adhaerens]EDV20153.1 predicted protein [Trichoplax adhaerens]|eukprot:XP_002117314.1 predicted protein [Trichoplax adhaerens]
MTILLLFTYNYFYQHSPRLYIDLINFFTMFGRVQARFSESAGALAYFALIAGVATDSKGLKTFNLNTNNLEKVKIKVHEVIDYSRFIALSRPFIFRTQMASIAKLKLIESFEQVLSVIDRDNIMTAKSKSSLLNRSTMVSDATKTTPSDRKTGVYKAP